jgi:hypothetical protein
MSIFYTNSVHWLGNPAAGAPGHNGLTPGKQRYPPPPGFRADITLRHERSAHLERRTA